MTEQLEKKVYSPWAYTDNEDEKAKINREIFSEIKDKARCVGGSNGYGHNMCLMEVIDKEYFKDLEDENTSQERKKELLNELALIADGGNLCFGYSYQGKRGSYENWEHKKFENLYMIRIFTD